MKLDIFSRQVRAAEQRAASLSPSPSESEAPSAVALQQTVAELGTALEELQVAEEELREQNEELSAAALMVDQERRRYADLFDFAPEAYLVTNGQGAIREANVAAARLLGVPRDLLLGKPLSTYVPMADRRKFRSQLNRLLEGGGLDDWQIGITPRTGDSFVAAVSASVERGREGSVAGIRWLLRDASERQREAERLQRWNEELEEHVRQRSAELAAVNERLRRAMAESHHRIKNNLQVVSALAELEDVQPGDLVPAEALRRIGRHARSLAAVHDLLTDTAWGDGDVQHVSVEAALEKLLPQVQGMVGRRRLTWEVEDTALPARQVTALAVLVNELVSNAAKHGEGEVGVEFRAEGSAARLTVSDDGPGYPPGFDLDQQGRTGLQLVRMWATWDLQGAVSFENRPEGGARAVVTFPLRVL